MKWDEAKFQEERTKSQQEASTQTTIFLQFYSPEPDYDDLGRANTIWHIYMTVDGRKFEGKAKKARGKLIEFQAIFPDYDMFSTPYEITFDISTADVVRREVKFTMASTLGEAEFDYSAGN
jgi:hypothetical protein